MLFELNNNDYNLDLEYFNLDKYDNYKMNKYDKNNYDIKKYKNENNYKNKEIDLENGFYLGNLFTNSYEQYKNYKPKKINAYSERQKLLLKLHELDFILNDLNLYLDLNPNDQEVYEKFKKTALEYDILKKKYYDKYQVLELCSDTKNKYTWIKNPWPWDGDYYV